MVQRHHVFWFQILKNIILEYIVSHVASKSSLTSFKEGFIFVSLPVLFTPRSWCNRDRQFLDNHLLFQTTPGCLRGQLRKDLYAGSATN